MSITRPIAATEAPATVSSDDGDDPDLQPPIEITIIHGSVATAEYALMIGGFADEQLGGQERFIDRQFAGLLASWEEVGLFPTKVGASRFMELNPDVETEPPGCYVIGLGSVVDLQRHILSSKLILRRKPDGHALLGVDRRGLFGHVGAPTPALSGCRISASSPGMITCLAPGTPNS